MGFGKSRAVGVILRVVPPPLLRVHLLLLLLLPWYCRNAALVEASGVPVKSAEAPAARRTAPVPRAPCLILVG